MKNNIFVAIIIITIKHKNKLYFVSYYYILTNFICYIKREKKI